MTDLCHSDLNPGDHAWATINGELLVVMREEGAYHVCGPWECGAKESAVTLIQKIPRPEGTEGLDLYYA